MIQIRQKNILGFTLVELTVVMVIIGLLLAGLLVPLREGIKQERRATTLNNLKTIEEALHGYAVANGRLPCPDCRNAADGNCGALAPATLINDGLEDFDPANPNDCAVDFAPGAGGNEGNVLEGNIPWVTLGVENVDEWESWYTYAVTDSVADLIGNGTPGNIFPAGGCVNPNEALSTIDICPIGNITVDNRSIDAGICPPAPAPPAFGAFNNVATNVYAVVISHGANITRAGAGVVGTGLIDPPPLCSEQENYTAPGVASDGVYVSSPFINPGEPGALPAAAPNQLGIDDQLIWISPNILKSKLVQAGRLP